MQTRRLSMAPYLGVALVLTGVQWGAALQLFGSEQMAAAIAVILVGQILKAVPTSWRLRDAGRHPWAAVPMAAIPGLGLLAGGSYLLGSSVSDDALHRPGERLLVSAGALEVLGEGVRIAAGTAGGGLGLAVAFGAFAGVGEHLALSSFGYLQTQGGAEGVSTFLAGTAGFLALYTVLQFAKRKTASRASWVPSLLMLPIAAIAGAVRLAGDPTGQMAPAALSLLLMAFDLAYGTFAGALVAFVWLRLAQAWHKTGSASLSEAMEGLGGRLFDVAGAHGARVQLVAVGMQLLIPGIYYAIQYAFADVVAVLDPERAALERSGKLASAIKALVFRVLFAWMVVGQFVYGSVAVVAVGPGKFMEAFFDPRLLPMWVYVVQGIGFALAFWVCELGLYALYEDRLESLRRKRAKKAAAEAVANDGETTSA